jgi:hypothetical protein
MFDLREKQINNWLNEKDFMWNFKEDLEDNETEDDWGALKKHFAELRQMYENADNLKLGRRPDLTDVLVHMAMAASAVCALRLISSEKYRIEEELLRLLFIEGALITKI